jgi:uncharacterized membrane protein
MKDLFPRKQALMFGWETAKKNIRFYIIVLLIVSAISLVFSMIDDSLSNDQVIPRFIIGIASWVVSSITSIGLIQIALNFVDKKKSIYADLFTHYDKTVNYMAGSSLYGLAVGLGLILLIIPGIYFGLRLQFFSYFTVEKNLGPIEALKSSWDITRGHTWQLLMYGLVVIGINLLGILCLLIGLLWTIPMTQLSTAYVFRHLSQKNT